ncbi:hypothetical protein M2333_002904 [Sphingobium sp. B11D3B]|nr:hypothetical protein [Sphingobium sp. B10D3B]MCW2383147.1 hypothetical protein [Sphingobium sp. B2D3B]MCW2389858.1 hypothetical protein [Sphingobium sp. B11D3B]MCW2399877.1 hypothetical protein [Sphingobium sp. B2D3C]MCW2403283.1 hypothetical protein [Sphingobium sp. B10D7B]MCW2406980.1 hypothetical protein [Sphingobium xanthum]MCW2410602.1 hypothetical protein [Sphingobium sp. B8D3D]MCW2413705.1 hypothetical protein [Sphingobium sp. B8D3A]
MNRARPHWLRALLIVLALMIVLPVVAQFV